MKTLFFGLFLPIFLCQELPLESLNDTEIDLTTEELVRKYGYPFEVHTTETPDGYTLTLYRISHGHVNNEKNLKPIFMMHGLMGSAENYIIAGRYNSSLAYFLADNGYDVWLGNSRGNSKFRKHKVYNFDQPEFWDYEWHDIAVYDVRSSIDYILKETGSPKLSYIGHSQGGTVFFVLLSEFPEYNEKINSAVLLAPAVYFKHSEKKLKMSTNHFNFIRMVLQAVGYHSIPPVSEDGEVHLLTLCQEDDFFKKICKRLLNWVSENLSDHFKQDITPILMKYSQPCSIGQLEHFSQEIQSGRFAKFNYSTSVNMIKYGSEEPPDYKISNVQVPVALFYGKGDIMVNYEDVEDLAKDLPNCYIKYMMPDPKWTHTDFITAFDANDLLFEPLLNALKQHEN